MMGDETYHEWQRAAEAPTVYSAPLTDSARRAEVRMRIDSHDDNPYSTTDDVVRWLLDGWEAAEARCAEAEELLRRAEKERHSDKWYADRAAFLTEGDT
jgi:hypothetical protein